jgi:hypothetical protein
MNNRNISGKVEYGQNGTEYIFTTLRKSTEVKEACMTKVKGFTYDPVADKDVIDHIDAQGNGSRYVWDLVRKDMENNNLETIVQRLLNKYLNDKEKTPSDDRVQ